ncbi:MAG: CPBP family intramembrane metalloprotease [Kiritimatiellae bacterium]|nr:CPBP family intramembrane metalloprotease [Kiritimatiellia bacterium]
MHHRLSAVPVFALGILACVLYRQSRSLAGPLLAHAVHNAIALGASWSLLGVP